MADDTLQSGDAVPVYVSTPGGDDRNTVYVDTDNVNSGDPDIAVLMEALARQVRIVERIVSRYHRDDRDELFAD